MPNPSPHRPSAASAPSPVAARSRAEEVQTAFRFFGTFLRRPIQVGSVVPSSPALARALIAPCPLEQARAIVELGPGTGAITQPILHRLHPQARFLAMELEPSHAQELASRFPRVIVCHDSAEHLEWHLRQHNIAEVDCVISGLPWAVMNARLQERILGAAVRSLARDGVFVAFGYAHARSFPATRRFRRSLERHFGSLTTSRVVWRNVPPAFVYICRQPTSTKT